MHQELTVTYGELLLGMALCFGLGLGVVAVFWRMAADARLELESMERTQRLTMLRQARRMLREINEQRGYGDVMVAVLTRLDLVMDVDRRRVGVKTQDLETQDTRLEEVRA
jgi:hypothetical protein